MTKAIQLGSHNLTAILPPLATETKTVANAPNSVVADDFQDSNRAPLHDL